MQKVNIALKGGYYPMINYAITDDLYSVVN
jgi:hypothetical protein